MSLRFFHIVFIIASVLLAFGFGIWCLRRYAEEPETLNLIFGVASLVTGVLLIGYGIAVFKKLKKISQL